MAPVCCFTSFTLAYLPRALVLVRTLRAAHPDWAIHAVLVDRTPSGVDVLEALAQFDIVVHAEALGIPGFKAWMFKHDLVEACTAVKGRMLRHLLEAGFERVVYLDPDIAVFHPLANLVPALDSASILLTPHQVEPSNAESAFRDNEATSMRYGIFNLGFLAVRNDDIGRRFAHWWNARLYEACYDDVPRGVFTDQKYCDLVPALFERVAIDRDPGCNVASWNLNRRILRISGDGITSNGSPLKFYHFTKIGAAGDIMTDRYAGDNVEVFEIWNWYKREIAKTTLPGLPPDHWHYGAFDDGTPIPRTARLFYRSRRDVMEYFNDPFAMAGDSYHNWLARNEPIALFPDRL